MSDGCGPRWPTWFASYDPGNAVVPQVAEHIGRLIMEAAA